MKYSPVIVAPQSEKLRSGVDEAESQRIRV
jgi:hypothetical protein